MTLSENQYAPKFIRAAKTKAWATYAKDYGRLTRTPTDFAKLSEGLARAIQEVLLKSADPKKALDAAASEYNGQHKE